MQTPSTTSDVAFNTE